MNNTKFNEKNFANEATSTVEGKQNIRALAKVRKLCKTEGRGEGRRVGGEAAQR